MTKRTLADIVGNWESQGLPVPEELSDPSEEQFGERAKPVHNPHFPIKKGHSKQRQTSQDNNAEENSKFGTPKKSRQPHPKNVQEPKICVR